MAQDCEHNALSQAAIAHAAEQPQPPNVVDGWLGTFGAEQAQPVSLVDERCQPGPALWQAQFLRPTPQPPDVLDLEPSEELNPTRLSQHPLSEEQLALALRQALQAELQKALREELPLALQKELPRALSASPTHSGLKRPLAGPTIGGFRHLASSEALSHARSPVAEGPSMQDSSLPFSKVDSLPLTSAVRKLGWGRLKNEVLSPASDTNIPKTFSPHSPRSHQSVPEQNLRSLGKSAASTTEASGTSDKTEEVIMSQNSSSLSKHGQGSSNSLSQAVSRKLRATFAPDEGPEAGAKRRSLIDSLGLGCDDALARKESNQSASSVQTMKKSNSNATTSASDNLRKRQLEAATQKKRNTTHNLSVRLSQKGLGWSKQMQVTAFHFTQSPVFIALTTFLITLNAIVIGIQTNWMSQSLSDKSGPLAFTIIDLFFCVFFTAELGIRIYAFQYHFLVIDWQWNMFDSFLVVTQGLELGIELSNGHSDSDGKGPNVSFMRVLRVLRLVRVMRLIRVVRYISELRTIVRSIFGSLKSLGCTIIIIALLIYVVGISLTQVVTQHLQGSDDEVARIELQEHFGSVPMSCLVLFQTITNGIDWSDVVNPLIDHISPLMAVLICFYMAFSQFAMLNVITGVFVESALKNDADEKDANMVARLLHFLSGDEDGFLSVEAFEEKLEDPHLLLFLESVDLDPGETRALFELLDHEQNGIVESHEFVMGCQRLCGEAKAIDLLTLMYENRAWFNNLDDRLYNLKIAMEGGRGTRKVTAASMALAQADDSATVMSAVTSVVSEVDDEVLPGVVGRGTIV